MRGSIPRRVHARGPPGRHVSRELTTRWCTEHELHARERGDLQSLLSTCFEGHYATRHYFKQLPHLRVLGCVDDRLVGQIGVDHRMIRVGDEPVEIFGLIDVCVDPAHRSRGYASQLLRQVERRAAEHGIDRLLLFADDGRLYERCGYTRLVRPCRWLGIHEHATVGLLERTEDCVYVKALGAAAWPEGPIDMLGYLF